MQSPSFKFFFSSSEGSSGSDCDTSVGVGRVGVKRSWGVLLVNVPTSEKQQNDQVWLRMSRYNWIGKFFWPFYCLPHLKVWLTCFYANILLFLLLKTDKQRKMVEQNAVIETDHQLELEFPSILNGNNKIKSEVFIYFALNVNWILFTTAYNCLNL